MEHHGERSQWLEAYQKSPAALSRATTQSGVAIEAVYGSEDGEYPGLFPYSRGIHPAMYRSRLWTMRMFAGFGTAPETNQRFHEIIAAGGTGISTAYDMPTLLGIDSDDPRALGEVGRCGVAIDTLDDVADLYDGIDLSAITTSMTINAPAAVIFAMFVANAENHGIARSQLGGTLQNDILKEYQAQHEYVFPPRPSLRLVRDTMVFASREMPHWHPLSISGYHIREAGSTAAQEVAFTLANGFAYVELARRAGLAVDHFAPQLSFFFNAHIDFFEEVAKYRCARRLWATWMRDHYGALDERSWQLRFHAQTAGVSLTAQQPDNNHARTAIEALAAVMGGAQSLHTNSFDEAWTLPSADAARVALRTQQVIAYETNVSQVADPLGGSWFVESLTDQLGHDASQLLEEIREMGEGSMLEGCLIAIDNGWFEGHIADAAYAHERAVQRGERIIVGVNAFLDATPAPAPVNQVNAEGESLQRERLARVRQARSDDQVRATLSELTSDATDPNTNLMPALMNAVQARASVGEIMSSLADVFGRHQVAPR
ncbi:MAG: methylmalonyl-CoA mutase [Acidimicrobiaceae bacterium]|nr:methylmalonyl-CoA mutase [Acidimicrobiaceae bacterium]